ncbi:MAG: helix-turn-helix domain-containing protein [Actinobacteria bacterium]|nr:helix-turn-helix domain-containing protein [Actinomycetota bacterium]
MHRNRRFRPDLLRKARLGAGYSQAELARLIAVSTVTVKAWETGRRAPRPATQRQVADALGLGFDDLEVAEPDGWEDLRRLRDALGWTRAEAAERLGLEPFTLQRVEEGLELPPDPRKMARVYGVSRMELAAAARRVAR